MGGCRTGIGDRCRLGRSHPDSASRMDGQAELAKALIQSGRDKEAETHYTKATQILESLAAMLQQPRMRQHFLQAPPAWEIYNALGHRPLAV